MGKGKGGSPAKICVERDSNKSSEAQEGEVTGAPAVENLVPSSTPRAKGRAGNQANKSWWPPDLFAWEHVLPAVNSSTKHKNELLQTGQLLCLIWSCFARLRT